MNWEEFVRQSVYAGSVAQGTQGDIYRAVLDGRDVAVKRYRDACSDYASSSVSFLGQIDWLEKNASNPFVPNLLWYGEVDGRYVYVMDYIEGKRINALQRFTTAQVRKYRRALVRALTLSYRLTGRAHGDFGVHNFMIGSGGRVWIFDCGSGIYRSAEWLPDDIYWLQSIFKDVVRKR